MQCGVIPTMFGCFLSLNICLLIFYRDCKSNALVNIIAAKRESNIHVSTSLPPRPHPLKNSGLASTVRTCMN